MEGYYGIGLGIDQESAIFISQELNGQPKFPCSIVYFRRDDVVEARCTHQGYTFLEFHGHVTGVVDDPSGEYSENDWWIKSSRAVGGVEKSYDFPPHVVRVASTSDTAAQGDRRRRPRAARQPVGSRTPSCCRCASSCRPTSCGASRRAREITLAGPLDPIAFWPYADTIGGSRWPGDRGGPRFKH